MNFKLKLKHIPALGVIALSALGAGSCTDKLAFGDAFLDKAPGGNVTADTVFSKPEFARYYLAQLYAYQYYNLPTGSTNNSPQWYNYWKGMPDLLGDTHHSLFSQHAIFTDYYNGMLTSSGGGVYPYQNMRTWENVRGSYILMDNIDRVPGMTDEEKARMKDEAKCLMIFAYFNAFRNYGGLPIVKGAFTGTESEYQGRSSVAQTVDFMVGVLDEVINSKNLQWGFTGADAGNETGHWTLAGAMALKIQILQFAASPLFNSEQPYYEGKYQMEHSEHVWYGGYDPARWTRLRNACKDFFDALNANGIYHLVVPAGTTQEDYAWAYRSSYMMQDSPEIIHSIRVASTANDNAYRWFMLGFGDKNCADNGTGTNDRCAPNPTQEYIEMFPWADGTPFDWDKTAANQGPNGYGLDEMFIKGERVEGEQFLQNVKYTRDPRLYETVGVNNQQCIITWSDGSRSGEPYEAYVGGTVASTNAATENGVWGTGYRNLKYVSGKAFLRQFPQWSPILLSDIYLTYAEAIIQDGGSADDALRYVDAVRARVGLKGLKECNPDKNLNDKDVLIEEILRERACELALQTSRYYDLIRYKRKDRFEKQLHGIRIYRMLEGQRCEDQWYNGDRNTYKDDPSNPRFYQPNHFEYEKFPITTGARIWWTQGFDPKWYLQPFPITEVNKGYGLYQNPGW